MAVLETKPHDWRNCSIVITANPPILPKKDEKKKKNNPYLFDLLMRISTVSIPNVPKCWPMLRHAIGWLVNGIQPAWCNCLLAYN